MSSTNMCRSFWMVGPNWPHGGEIDILEGVNDQTNNGMTLHTGPDCKIGPDTSIFAGEVTTPNCDVEAKDQNKNAGCSIEHPSKDSYGTGLNAIGGGVYATQWTAEAISVWYFPRNSVPKDALGESPNPDGWGIPAAKFTGGCDIENMFKEQQIVFNTAFCGDWAGNAWDSGSCAKKAATCDEYVQNNPEAFKDAYWTINGLRVYKDNSNDTPAPSASIAPGYSTVISEPVSVPTENATEPAVSSGYAAIPTEIPSKAPILSTSKILAVPTATVSEELPEETSAPVAEVTPSGSIPTSEILAPSETKSSTDKPAASTSAAETSSKVATPTKPAGPVGTGGMPGFQWPPRGDAPAASETEPVDPAPEPTKAPSGSMSLPVESLPSKPTNKPVDSKPSPAAPSVAPSAAPPVAPSDAPAAAPTDAPDAAPTVTKTDIAQQTVYQTKYITVTARSEPTPAAGMDKVRAARFLREHRRRSAGHHAGI